MHFIVLQQVLVWLQNMEEQLTAMGPIPGDTDAVKEQMGALKAFKEEVHPKSLDIQSLNQQATDLTRESPTEQGATIREPMADVNKRWDQLLDGMSDRKSKLQNALLSLGQFQSAIDELLSWLGRTEQTLDEMQPVYGDPKVIEIELAKLKVSIHLFSNVFLFGENDITIFTEICIVFDNIV